jgi:opacity protein-like surface antigen
MKTIAAGLTLLLASCSAVAPAAQTGVETRDNRVSLYLGQRNLDEDDHDPVDEQTMFGIEYSHEGAGDPIGFEIGLMGSRDEGDVGGTDVEGTTSEIYGGVKKTFGHDVVRPYIGGGVSFIRATAEISGLDDDDDSSLAAYLHGGIGFQVSNAVILGLDARFLFGSDITLFGFETDADYGQLALFVGFAF